MHHGFQMARLAFRQRGWKSAKGSMARRDTVLCQYLIGTPWFGLPRETQKNLEAVKSSMFPSNSFHSETSTDSAATLRASFRWPLQLLAHVKRYGASLSQWGHRKGLEKSQSVSAQDTMKTTLWSVASQEPTNCTCLSAWHRKIK